VTEWAPVCSTSSPDRTEAVAQTRSVRRGEDDLAVAHNFIECDRERRSQVSPEVAGSSPVAALNRSSGLAKSKSTSL
jgi:hypothetical protein